MLNSSSMAITTSTLSRLSKPSSVKEAPVVIYRSQNCIAMSGYRRRRTLSGVTLSKLLSTSRMRVEMSSLDSDPALYMRTAAGETGAMRASGMRMAARGVAARSRGARSSERVANESMMVGKNRGRSRKAHGHQPPNQHASPPAASHESSPPVLSAERNRNSRIPHDGGRQAPAAHAKQMRPPQ